MIMHRVVSILTSLSVFLSLSLAATTGAFSTEIVTATITGDVHVITHPVEATFHRDDDGNLEMSISDNLADKIDKYFSTAKKRCGWDKRSQIRDSGRMYPSRRGTGGTVPVYTPPTPFDLPACLTDMKGPLQQAVTNLPTELLGLIQGVKGIVLEPLHLGGSITKYLDELYKLAFDEVMLSWVPMVAVMVAVDVLVAILEWYVNSPSTKVATKFKIGEKVWLENDAEPGQCAKLKDKPICNNGDCEGDRGEHCTVGPNRGCKCLPLAKSYFDTHPTWDEIQKGLGAINKGKGAANPNCNDITPSQGWTTPGAALDKVDDFCDEAKHLEGTTCDTDPVSETYFGGTEKEFSFTIDFIGSRCGQKIKFTPNQCREHFQSTIKGCHGDDPTNPGDLKYGAVYTDVQGSTFTFKPVNIHPVQECGYNEHKSQYMEDAALNQAEQDFCHKVEDESANNASGETTDVRNKGEMNEVHFTANYVPKTKVTYITCYNAIHRLNTGCDPPGDQNNVMNYKSGGTIALGNVGQAYYTVLPWIRKGPRPSTKTIDSGDDKGNIDPSQEIWSPQTVSKVDADKLQKCLKDWKVHDPNNDPAGNGSPSNDMDCDGADGGKFTFHMYLHQWNSAKDCYSACVNGLSDKINRGASKEYCIAKVSEAKCTVGYELK